jgi:micrococcal nuclease
MYEYRAVLVRVVDADTIICDLDLGFYTWIHHQYIRLHGIDAWEVRGEERPQGLLAKQAVIDLYASTSPYFRVRTVRRLKGKYGRWLGIIVLADGTNLNDWLVENDHAERVDY